MRGYEKAYIPLFSVIGYLLLSWTSYLNDVPGCVLIHTFCMPSFLWSVFHHLHQSRLFGSSLISSLPPFLCLRFVRLSFIAQFTLFVSSHLSYLCFRYSLSFLSRMCASFTLSMSISWLRLDPSRITQYSTIIHTNITYTHTNAVQPYVYGTLNGTCTRVRTLLAVHSSRQQTGQGSAVSYTKLLTASITSGESPPSCCKLLKHFSGSCKMVLEKVSSRIIVGRTSLSEPLPELSHQM